MKKGIHPELYQVIVRCNCGAEFETFSTKKVLRVDVCIECHPLFGGKRAGTPDARGRSERYRQRYSQK